MNPRNHEHEWHLWTRTVGPGPEFYNATWFCHCGAFKCVKHDHEVGGDNS